MKYSLIILLILSVAFTLFAQTAHAAEYFFEKAGEVNSEQLVEEIEGALGILLLSPEPDAFITIDNDEIARINIEMLTRELTKNELEQIVDVIQSHKAVPVDLERRLSRNGGERDIRSPHLDGDHSTIPIDENALSGDYHPPTRPDNDSRSHAPNSVE